jgi:hypothetical protein
LLLLLASRQAALVAHAAAAAGSLTGQPLLAGVDLQLVQAVTWTGLLLALLLDIAASTRCCCLRRSRLCCRRLAALAAAAGVCLHVHIRRRKHLATAVAGARLAGCCWCCHLFLWWLLRWL